jgi:hypothetical protein
LTFPSLSAPGDLLRGQTFLFDKGTETFILLEDSVAFLDIEVNTCCGLGQVGADGTVHTKESAIGGRETGHGASNPASVLEDSEDVVVGEMVWHVRPGYNRPHGLGRNISREGETRCGNTHPGNYGNGCLGSLRAGRSRGCLLEMEVVLKFSKMVVLEETAG